MNRISLFIVATLAFAMVSFGQPDPAGPLHQDPAKNPAQRMRQGPPHADMREELLKKLNLTDQQAEQFKKLHTDMERRREKNQSKIKLARIDLRELAQVDTPDRTAIEKKLKEITDLQHQEKLDMVDHLFAAKALLTPEQQKVWKEHMKAMLPDGPGLGGPMQRGMMRGMRGR